MYCASPLLSLGLVECNSDLMSLEKISSLENQPLLHVCTYNSQLDAIIVVLVCFVVSYMKSYDVYLGNNDLLFSEGSLIEVNWSPVSIFPMEPPNTYNVDIDLIEMNIATENFKKLLSLASDIPNTGSMTVRMPNVEEAELWQDSISPVIVQVSISNNTINEARKKRNTASGILTRLAYKVARYAPVRYVKKLARQATQRIACEAWGMLESPNIAQDILNRLPPCPSRIRDIMTPNSGFTEERLSSLSPVIGEIQTAIGNLNLPGVGRIGDHLGYTVIDDKFREFFHPDTTNCFRQRVTIP